MSIDQPIKIGLGGGRRGKHPSGAAGRPEAISIAPLPAGGETEWAAFLASCNNGTLFHDLGFLAYHQAGRFRFNHLVARRNSAVVALVPGGIVETGGSRVFVSPLGASVGGPAVCAELDSRQMVELIAALQDYAAARGWDGLRMTLAPPIYDRRPAETLSFALSHRGFRLENRWLCHLIPLEASASARYETLFRQSQASRVRAQRRKGMTVIEGGIDQLAAFLPVFHDTYDRHGVKPTHSPAELADLLQRLPDRIRIHIAMLGDVAVAGILVFLLNSQVAYSFYICMSSQYARENGNIVIFAALVDRLAQQGYRWLDLGPSAQIGRFNDGVAFFKESIGAIGHCRDQWFWAAAAARSREDDDAPDLPDSYRKLRP
jgi:hypothetical protein